MTPTPIAAQTKRNFVILVFIYLAMLTTASVGVYWLDANAESSSKSTEIQQVDKANITAVLVDQLKENRKSYSNNVWTTLGTIIGALGLALGSAKFQKILQSGKYSIAIVQGALVVFYALHALAYGYYQRENARLMDQLEQVAGSIDYYKGYLLEVFEVTLNLSFDTFLFLLLAFIALRVADLSLEEK